MKVLAMLLVFMALWISGCSARNFYDGLRMQQETECQKMQGYDRDDCLRRSGMSYDDYQRQLKEQDQKK